MSAKIIIASGPVIVEGDWVLLNKHGDTPFWKFCEGKVEDFNTNLVENARREVKEEMRFSIEILDDKPFVVHVVKQTPAGDIDVILVHYLARRVGEIRPSADIREWNWFNLSRLPDDLAPNIIPTLKHFGFIT